MELPGGKLEEGESPEKCVGREIEEELNLCVEVGPLLDAWVYEVLEGVRVLILTYGCFVEGFEGLARSEEHSDLGIFSVSELESLNLPEGYRRSMRDWREHPAFMRRSGVGRSRS